MAASFTDFGYEEVKVIGRGQYGMVYLVRHIEEGKSYVCKSIDLTCLPEKERDSAKQEVELLRRLDHANIVEYKENFQMGNAIVIAMQYCECGDVATHIKDMARRRTRINEAQIMNWFVQTLFALEYVHGQRILHRDLKTSNLFLIERSTVIKLGDFGISRQFGTATELAMSVVGTPHYMSPEVCENKPYTYKSDVWSLGCVLYELCMLKHAFAADNLLGLVHKIVSGKYETIPPMYSANLNNLIQRMLTRNPAMRPSIRTLLDDKHLQTIVSQVSKIQGVVSPSPPGTRSSNRTGGRGSAGAGTSTSSRLGVQPIAKGGAAPKSRSGKQKPAVGAWGGVPKSSQGHADRHRGEKASTTAEDVAIEECYEDDFCSEDDTDSAHSRSDRDEVDFEAFEVGILSTVPEEARDHLDYQTMCATTVANAMATMRAATVAAAASVPEQPTQDPGAAPVETFSSSPRPESKESASVPPSGPPCDAEQEQQALAETAELELGQPVVPVVPMPRPNSAELELEKEREREQQQIWEAAERIRMGQTRATTAASPVRQHSLRPNAILITKIFSPRAILHP